MKLTRNGITRIEIRADNAARGAFQAELEAQGVACRVETVVAQTRVQGHLAALVGDEVLIRSRAMYGDGELLQTASSYVPLALARGTKMTEKDPGPGGIFSRLAEIGHGPVSFTEEIEIDSAGEDDWEIFSGSRAFYRIRRIARDDGGLAVDVTDMMLPVERWKLVYSWEKK